MQILSKISLFVLFFGIILASCQKENIDDIITEDPNYIPDTIAVNPFIAQLRSISQDSLNIDCMSIPYPIEFLRASGNTVTVNSEDELEEVSMQQDSLVDFVYPFSAFVNNMEFTISKIEDLAEAIIPCFTEEYECGDVEPHVLLFYNALNIFTLNKYEYKINYPVTLVIEGNQVVINNDSEYVPAIGGNPSRFPKGQLVYPITVTQFGRTIVLNSDQDVCDFSETLNEPCQNKPAHIQFFFNEGPGTPINCTYFIDYPVTVTLSGANIVVQSREAYRELLNSSSSAYDNIQLVYPVNAWKLTNNQELTFGTDADICQYLNNCQ
jgi:hypothetical protein